MTPDTLPRLLLRNAASMGRRPAFRLRDRGIWQTLSWTEFAALSSEFALGLLANGVQRSARVAVVGENRPRLYAAMLATQAIGGAAVPLHPEAEPGDIAATLRHAGVSVVVTQDREHAERILALGRELPEHPLIICETVPTPEGDHAPRLVGFDMILSAGRDFVATHPRAIQAAIDAGRSDDLALMLYPSGAGRHPASVSHRQLLAAAAAIVGAEDVRPDDDAFCYLPISELGDATYSLALGLMVGFTCNCPEAPHTVLRDLREIGPRMLLAPPLVWAALQRAIDDRAAMATPLKRRIFSLFTTIALEAERRRDAGEPVLPVARLFGWLGELLINRPVRDQLGLSRLRWAHTGGEPLDPALRRRFRALGVKLGHEQTDFTRLVPIQPEEPAHA